MKDISIQKQILFYQSRDKNKSGHLAITTSHPVDIKKITGHIYLETRGRKRSTKELVKTVLIKDSFLLLENQNHEIPFSFQLSEEQIETYNGINVDHTYNFEISIEFENHEIDLVDDGIFSKIKSFFTNEKELVVSKYFNVKHSNYRYDVKELNSELKRNINFLISLAFIVVAGSIGLLLFNSKLDEYIIVAIIVPAVISLVFTQLYINKKLGTVFFEVLKEDDTFICNLEKQGTLMLQNPVIYYEIYESVRDDRGTSTVTHESSIVTSEKINLEGFDQYASVRFSYPSEEGLYSLNYSDTSIYWKMILKGKLFGFNFNYTSRFTVGKKLIIN